MQKEISKNAVIVYLRGESGLTQKEFGKLVGLKQSEVSRLESNEWKLGERKFKQILNKLGYDCYFVVENKTDKLRVEIEVE